MSEQNSADAVNDESDAAATESGAAGTERDAAGTERGASPRRRGIVTMLTLGAVVLVALFAGSVWWQSRDDAAERARVERLLADEIEVLRSNQRRLEDRLLTVSDELERRDAEMASLRDGLDALPVELRAVERRIEDLQGGRIEARDSWLRQQAEYYLVLANTELGLGGRVDASIAALELADGVLRELGDPALANTRAAVRSGLQALRAVELPDLEGTALELRGLAGRVAGLPMRDEAPGNFEPAADDSEDVEPGLARLLSSTRSALTSIVRVERQDEPVEQLLTESERRVARRQLELELQLARLALVEGREADFRASLEASDAMLSRDFNREARSVVTAREMLGRMMRIELSPRLPDISDSLRLLRNADGSD